MLTTLLVAVSSLTILPAVRGRPSEARISASRAYYPVVGILLGLLMVGLSVGLDEISPELVTGATLVVALLIATRGLHLDGLMDVCDGLFGGYTRERRLEIMRDTRVGAFAVAGAIGLVLMKWTTLVALLSFEGTGRYWVLLIFPSVSRWAMVLSIAAFPYARSEGLGAPFKREPNPRATLTAGAIALLVSLLLGGPGGAVIFALASGAA